MIYWHGCCKPNYQKVFPTFWKYTKTQQETELTFVMIWLAFAVVGHLFTVRLSFLLFLRFDKTKQVSENKPMRRFVENYGLTQPKHHKNAKICNKNLVP